MVKLIKLFLTLTPTEPWNDRYAMFGYDGTNFLEQGAGVICNHIVCLLNSLVTYILVKIVQRTYRYFVVRRMATYIAEDDPVLNLHQVFKSGVFGLFVSISLSVRQVIFTEDLVYTASDILSCLMAGLIFFAMVTAVCMESKYIKRN